MTAGQKIYDLREKGGITQAAFAQKIEVNLSTVQSWENGTLPVDENAASLLSKAFCVDPGYFKDDGQFPDRQLFGDDGGPSRYIRPQGFCYDCGLPIYEMPKSYLRTEHRGKSSYHHSICGLCQDRINRKKEERELKEKEESKKRLRSGLIWGAVIIVVAAIVVIVAFAVT